MINLDYPKILDLFREHLDPKRTESASFLIWYLENYYRLDTQDAIDSVCDNPGDKGIDGIYVNDNDMTITIFQSRISQRCDSTIGDSSLRTFVGSISQFVNREAIENIISSAGESEITRLIKRLDLLTKIATHELRGEFLSNINIDANGEAFLRMNPNILFIGKNELISTYISDAREIPVHNQVIFDIAGFHIAQYIVDVDTKAIIAPIKASQLVTLQGIADQSLYTFNVRGPLGRTQVNRDIEASIIDRAKHKLFPLFHNGITIIAKQLNVTDDSITIEDYFVVNGCQSLTALYEKRRDITDDLRVLTKLIQMDPTSKLSEMVTRYSNNQNGVRPRDFMANNPSQIRLQRDLQLNFTDAYALEIKRGEIVGRGTKISNEDAGLYLMAFDLKEPWATHRKYLVFEDKHASLFARPEVNADRIVLCQVIAEAITDSSSQIENSLFAKYTITKYFFLYLIRLIIEKEELGDTLLLEPNIFIRNSEDRAHFKICIGKIIGDTIIDLNAEINEYGTDFDYRGKLRDSEWVKQLAKKLVSERQKLVARGRIPSFRIEWETR